MPEPIQFEQVRHKMAEDLLPAEVEIIVANADKLDEEEKQAFGLLLEENSSYAENPQEALDKAINEAVDNETTPPAPAATEPVAPVTPPAATPPADPNAAPITKAELDSYLTEKRKEWDAEGKTKAEQKVEEDKAIDFFEAGYKAPGWNEAAQIMWNKMAPLMEQRVIKTLEDRNAEWQKEQGKIKEAQTDAWKRFEGEFDTLSTNGLIPPRTDAQYETIKKQIVDLGVQYGRNNITDAYKLWSIIPVDKGGGLVTEAGNTPPPPDPKAQINRQKEASARIQASRGGMGNKPGGSSPGQPAIQEWSHIHSTNIDDDIDAAKRKYGIAG